jgi:hypothetical protein
LTRKGPSRKPIVVACRSDVVLGDVGRDHMAFRTVNAGEAVPSASVVEIRLTAARLSVGA